SQVSVKRLGARVGCSHLDQQFPKALIMGETLGVLPKRAAHTQPSPLRQEKRPDLADMGHRGQLRRPQIQALKTSDPAGGVHDYVNGLARGERLKIARLLLYGPYLGDSRIDAFRRDYLKDGDDSGCVGR